MKMIGEDVNVGRFCVAFPEGDAHECLCAILQVIRHKLLVHGQQEAVHHACGTGGILVFVLAEPQRHLAFREVSLKRVPRLRVARVLSLELRIEEPVP